MHRRLLPGLLLLAACFDAAANDLYATVNRLRTGAGACAAAPGLAPLRPNADLERTARDLAQGMPLQESLRQVGYGPARVSAFSSAGAALLPQAARQHCRQLQDTALTEVGIYEEARKVWIVLASPSTAPAAPARPAPLAATAAGQRILDLVNEARARPRKCGDVAFAAARPMRWNDILAAASRAHAEEMARYDYFSHKGRDGSDPWDRLERAGYRYRAMGENVAAGQRSPEEAVADWIGSPVHCANLMNPEFTEMGAAVAVNSRSELGQFWTQTFGLPR
jgi:uncharacterized protein YkwD